MRDIFDTSDNLPALGERFMSPLGVVEYYETETRDDDKVCDGCVFQWTSICRDGNIGCITESYGCFRKVGK
ncbi:MAG: hypothetical protein IKU86_00330 [Thermoguttaceae bacterium]|nr:hypothetical protein [Thermoguttaceae bacterium]